MKRASVSQYCVGSDCPVREAMRVLDAGGLGIVLVTDAERRLLGTITDGDIRRSLLGNVSLDLPAREFVAKTRNPLYPDAVWARSGTERAALLHLMHERTLRHVPLLDEQGRVVDLAVLDDLVPDEEPQLQALIMAGGFGTRLRPLTVDTPKPMLPVGGRPLLEHTIESLRVAGIDKVHLATFFRADKVVDHFKDGSDFGVAVEYLKEERPMGTAGALGLLEPPTKPMLVMNGDILTGVDFRKMFAFHRQHRAALTVGVRKYEMSVPYGVVECDGADVRRIVEKPTYTSFVNAGIYLLEPRAFEFVPRSLGEGELFNMTDLIGILIARGDTVASFPIHEYWLDIGKPEDYAQAQADVAIRELAGRP